MTTTAIHRTTPDLAPQSDPLPLGLLALARRGWVSLLVCVLLGVLVGAGIAAASPVTYTAQGQLLAGATSVDAAAVPSFTQAGQSLAQTYSRVFSGDAVRSRMHEDGFDAATMTATASPVPNSSVILVETEAPSAAGAVKAADAGISALRGTVTSLLDNSASITSTRERLRSAYDEQVRAEAVRNQLEEDDVKPDVPRYQEATADLGSAQATVEALRQLLADQVSASAQANGVAPLTSGHVTSTTSSQRFQLWGAVGLIAGLLAWLLLALARSRPLRRRRPVGA